MVRDDSANRMGTRQGASVHDERGASSMKDVCQRAAEVLQRCAVHAVIWRSCIGVDVAIEIRCAFWCEDRGDGASGVAQLGGVVVHLDCETPSITGDHGVRARALLPGASVLLEALHCGDMHPEVRVAVLQQSSENSVQAVFAYVACQEGDPLGRTLCCGRGRHVPVALAERVGRRHQRPPPPPHCHVENVSPPLPPQFDHATDSTSRLRRLADRRPQCSTKQVRRHSHARPSILGQNAMSTGAPGHPLRRQLAAAGAQGVYITLAGVPIGEHPSQCAVPSMKPFHPAA